MSRNVSMTCSWLAALKSFDIARHQPGMPEIVFQKSQLDEWMKPTEAPVSASGSSQS